MQWYHFIVPSFAVLALLGGWKTPRSVLWVALIMASYVISVAYIFLPRWDWIPWWPPAPGITFLCDAAAFLVVRELHKERWEMLGLGSLLLLSATIDLIQTWALVIGVPPALSSAVYGSILEMINVAAFLLIFGVGMMDRLNAGHGISRSAHRVVGGLSDFAHSTSKQKKPLTKW
ncbi:MAG: hypothetical protein LCH99_34270 [Proteobacteria bacterium]|nr:hypothetical protein [Pseudomonadota bacterium]